MTLQIKVLLLMLTAAVVLACGPVSAALPGSATPTPAQEILATATDTPAPIAPVTVSDQPATVPVECASWDTYTRQDLFFALSYPCEWEMSDGHTDNSFVFHNSQTVAMEPPGLMWFWISILPQGATFENGSVYNFMEEDFRQAIWDSAVGDTLVEHFDGEELAQFYTFTRLPDQEVSLVPAHVIENGKVWEMGENVRDRRYVVLLNDTWYVVGGYYNTPDGLALFDSILKTFQFIG